MSVLLSEPARLHCEAGVRFWPSDVPGVFRRVVDDETGEPVEPGSSGIVVVPREGWYRCESWRTT